jgi:hypothetical protein
MVALLVNLPIKFDVIKGGKHGGKEFYTEQRLSRLASQVLQIFSTSHQAD